MRSIESIRRLFLSITVLMQMFGLVLVVVMVDVDIALVVGQILRNILKI